MKQKLLCLLVLLLTATTGAMAQDYYAPSADEVIILNDVYDDSKSGFSSHSAIAWGGSATASKKKAGDPNKGGETTSSNVNCYSVKGTGQGKNITLSITGVSKVIVYYHGEPLRYIELRDGSKKGNIIGSGQTNTYYTEVALTATNQYSIFLHGTSNGSDDVDFYVYAIKLIAAPAPTSTYSVTLAEGTEDADQWTIEPNTGLNGGETVTAKYSGEKKVKSVKAVKKKAVDPAKAYMKWNADQMKLVATEIPESFTTVTSSTTTWSAGTYVVEGEDVNITGTIELSGDVDLIIKDGAKLTAQGISGESKNLRIYGQANQSGQLVVGNSGTDAISNINTLEVYSAKVEATAYSDWSCGFFGISTFNVYGGLVDAKCTASTGCGIFLNGGDSMNIYGGEVKAEGKGNETDGSYGIICDSEDKATVTVYGGKLRAVSAQKAALYPAITLKKGAGFTGKIEYSSDNSTWSETVDAEAKYVRAGY
jgi:hypothetical protein